MCGWLDAKRHPQHCRSICAVDRGKDTIRCSAEQSTPRWHDESEIVAGMQTKARDKAVDQGVFG